MRAQNNPSSNIGFTPTIKQIQTRKGSRETYARMEERGGWRTEISPDLVAFIAQTRSFFIATSNAEGQPYIQHRGGPPGFLKVLGDKTLGIADFKGNRQFITQGNLTDNAKAFIFLIDYERRRRIKIWGSAKIVENDEALISRLMPENYAARAEQALLFTIDAWDANCPQHIPIRFEADDVAAALAERDSRIEALEKQLAIYQNQRQEAQ